MTNKKSDVTAKRAFCNELLSNRGYQQAKVTASPADITAMKDGVTWYYEIKMTKRKNTYFGAATFTEWEQAFRDSEHYRFVIAITDDDERNFRFLEFTPYEFMKACTIPPFKINFNIDLVNNPPKISKHRSGTVVLTEQIFEVLNNAYKTLRKGDEQYDNSKRKYNQRTPADEKLC